MKDQRDPPGLTQLFLGQRDQRELKESKEVPGQLHHRVNKVWPELRVLPEILEIQARPDLREMKDQPDQQEQTLL